MLGPRVPGWRCTLGTTMIQKDKGASNERAGAAVLATLRAVIPAYDSRAGDAGLPSAPHSAASRSSASLAINSNVRSIEFSTSGTT